MPDKVIEFKFIFDHYLNNHKTIWSYSYKKGKSAYLKHTAAAIIMFLFGLWIDQFALFPWCTISGSIYLLYIVYKWLELLRSKKKYFNAVEKIGRNYESEKLVCTYTLNEAYFEYQDKEKTYRLAWHLFATPVFYKDKMMLFVKNQSTASFTLSREQLGDKSYEELINYLKAHKLVGT
jgi:hypothetical protein